MISVDWLPKLQAHKSRLDSTVKELASGNIPRARSSSVEPNRWLVVVGAMLVQLSLGSLYSWSVFVKPLLAAFPGSTNTQVSLPFTIALATFSITMVLAGVWQDRSGPKAVAIAGGLVLGLGNILASQAGQLELVYATYGVLGGIGIGLAYVCPITACIKWFPDKRGLVSGLAVAGFGAGSFFYAQFANYLISLGSPTSSWRQAFIILGAIYLISILAGAQLLRNPPSGWLPAGWNPSPSSAKIIASGHAWKEMVKTGTFYKLWAMFAFAASSGLMVIGHLSPFGQESGLTASEAATVVGVLALFNGAGRITWGFVSDRIGRQKTMLSMFALNATVMFLLREMGRTIPLLATAAATVGFCFGGTLAIFPSATADSFGTKHLGVNYGLMFTAYGMAGIIGPVVGALIHDLSGTYVYAFIVAATLSVISAALSLTLKNG